MSKPLDLQQERLLSKNLEMLKRLKNQSVSISTDVIDEEVVILLHTKTKTFVIAGQTYDESPWIDLHIYEKDKS